MEKTYADGLRFALLKVEEKSSMAILTQDEEETLANLREEIADELQTVTIGK